MTDGLMQATVNLVLTLVLIGGGMAVLVFSVGWLAAIGVLLVVWGNNVSLTQSRRSTTTTHINPDADAMWKAIMDRARREARSSSANPFTIRGDL